MFVPLTIFACAYLTIMTEMRIIYVKRAKLQNESLWYKSIFYRFFKIPVQTLGIKPWIFFKAVTYFLRFHSLITKKGGTGSHRYLMESFSIPWTHQTKTKKNYFLLVLRKYSLSIPWLYLQFQEFTRVLILNTFSKTYSNLYISSVSRVLHVY